MSLLASLVGPVAGLLDKVIPDKESGRSLGARNCHDVGTLCSGFGNRAVGGQQRRGKGQLVSI
jgi:hypothetical protein